MENKYLLSIFLLALLFSRCNCTKEVDCYDASIQPAFIGFQLSEIDTLTIRKYEIGNGFQKPIDTIVITYSTYRDAYRTSTDTTKIVYHYYVNERKGITAGFDWQILIPALNKTVAVSEIKSNKNSIKCSALAKDCSCVNELFSAKVDNQISTFPNPNNDVPFIYIRR